MKNSLIVILALIIGAVGGYFTWKYFLSNDSSTSSKTKKVTLENYKEAFQWGINVYPSEPQRYTLEGWREQMKAVSELGTGWIRLGYDSNTTNRLQENNDRVKAAEASNLQVFLVLDSTSPVDKVSNPYQDGFQVASEAVSNFKGRIKYYEVLNEIGGTTIKKDGGYSGEKESDVDPKVYAQVRDWSKGAVDAIKKNDSQAYIVVDSYWTHYAVIDMLVRDGLDFDILGWNWYSDMKMLGERKLEDGTLLVDKLKSYNKPLILMEVNAVVNKNKIDENEQSDYIQAMSDWAYKSGFVKGLYVSGLVDSPKTAQKEGCLCGIIGYKKSSSGSYILGDPKKAYYTFQEIIKKYSK